MADQVPNIYKSQPPKPKAVMATGLPPAAAINGRGPDVEVSLSAYLQAAVTAHQAGRFEDAKAAYMAILKAHPDHADALQLLGVLLHQQGSSEAGRSYLERAVAVAPEHPAARNNLGGVLRALGHREAAETHYAAACKLAPDDIGALMNHGLVLFESERFDAAERTYRTALAREPGRTEAKRKLAQIALRLGRHGEAEAVCLDLLRLNPDNAEDLANLATAIHYQGRQEEARPLFEKALALSDEGSELRHNLTTFLHPRERTLEMRAAFRDALAKNPGMWLSEITIAVNLIERGEEQAGRELIEDVLAVHGERAGVWSDIGALLLSAGRVEEAKPYFYKAIKLDPTFYMAWSNLGGALLSSGRPAEAVPMYRRALRANPGFVSAHVSLTRALRDSREFDQAHLFGRAAMDMPGFGTEHLPAILQLLNALCDFDALDRLGDVWDVCDRFKIDNLPIVFLDLLVFARSHGDVQRLCGLVRKWAANAEGLAAQAPLTEPHLPSPDGRLRLGILSSDLRSHSVVRFLKPLLDGYDRSKIAIYCYAPIRYGSDPKQTEIRDGVDKFTYVNDMTLRDIAQTIRRDSVDILLELNGFTHGTRLGALAYKPAPVQMSWFGFPFTSGLKAIDYAILDQFVKPLDDSTMVEEPLVMPDAWICFGTFKDVPIDPTLPMERNGYVTFGTLNNSYKYDRETIALWAKVMAQVPNSRFLMVRPEASSTVLCRHIAQEFAKHGFGADRFFILDNWQQKRDHLDYYNEIDISLDTFPVTGGTTTCEATWMGVPVVSLVGDAFHQRVSYSVLMHCGLEELCVRTEDEFIARAVALVNDPAKLKAWRVGLREAMTQSPLCDEARFLYQFQEMLEQVAQLHKLR